MLTMEIAERILAAAGKDNPLLPAPGNIVALKPVSGGDINQSFTLQTQYRTLFIKLNSVRMSCMFEAERAGLDAIAATGTLRCCKALALGTVADYSYLILEHLQLSTTGDWARAGNLLAAMHLAEQPLWYGFDTDSYCGTSLQDNSRRREWSRFFAEQRLAPQLARHFQLHITHAKVAGLVSGLRQILDSHQPRPSLVHGDLWRGNIAFCDGEPAIYDPAIYVGDAETDIAMTELFGRFPEPFYKAYAARIPTDKGYRLRRKLYQLYHILNHANLFGGGYRDDANRRLVDLVGSAALN